MEILENNMQECTKFLDELNKKIESHYWLLLPSNSETNRVEKVTVPDCEYDFFFDGKYLLLKIKVKYEITYRDDNNEVSVKIVNDTKTYNDFDVNCIPLDLLGELEDFIYQCENFEYVGYDEDEEANR